MSKRIRLSPKTDKIYAKKVSALRSALIAGEKSGPSAPFDFEEFIEHKRRQKRPSSILRH